MLALSLTLFHCTKMNYENKAHQIIKESIKSAIFIDEKARSFYQETVNGENEEILSVKLFENFKENGISLAIHKFSIGDEKNEELKKYLFEGRDLVLLDWKMDGENGEEFSLSLLSEITQAPHINFCAVYTSDEKSTEIYSNILTYFSGKDESFFKELKTKLEAYEDDLKPIFSTYNLINSSSNGTLIPKIKEIDNLFETLIADTGESKILDALKLAYIAFQNFHLSNRALSKPEVISPDSSTIVINNTLIAIIQKEKDQDVSNLIQRLATQFSKSKDSFTQLLGFEMQSVFSRDGSFIDANLLKVSLEALLEHRKYILAKDESDIPFKVLIKNVLIEHASMRLRTAKLALLDDEFLNETSKSITNPPSDEALTAMNVFYNSVHIESRIPEDLPSLNFGDVFEDDAGNYFICITALCDCYIPSKIDNNFYFAKGTAIDSSLALTLGDTAFISFLPNNKAVSWIAPETDKIIYDKETLDGSKIAIEYFKKFKYQPVYVKPVVYNVKTNKITNNAIEIRRVETKNNQEDLSFTNLNYITTIRPNYTQRIANHAFSHPVRVGIDFVKK